MKPEAEAAAASTSEAKADAADIKVERSESARYEKLADDKAPVIFTPAARPRLGRAAILAIAITLSAAAGSVVCAMAAVALS